jgi:mono/diheme cytochrome c family protein
MKRKTIIKRIGLLFMGTFLCFSIARAKESTTKVEFSDQAKKGMALFDGSTRFKNGGPSCITCHNVTNDKLIPGGLFAKDLTEVNGATAVAFAGTLPNAPMNAAYGKKKIEKEELDALSAFFDYTSATKDTQSKNSGFNYFLIGGIVGIIVLFLLVQVIWIGRKRGMVKGDIFKRQHSAIDAKF